MMRTEEINPRDSGTRCYSPVIARESGQSSNHGAPGVYWITRFRG
jgi:hypothetical protein